MSLTQAPKTLAEVRPDIPWPAELQTAMSRALERDPALRYPSTREFARAMQAAVAMMPVHGIERKPTRPLETAAPAAAPTVVSQSPDVNSQPRSSSLISRLRATRNAPRVTLIALAILLVGALSVRSVVKRRQSATYEQALAAYRAGRHDIAREGFLAASKNAPNDPMPHVYLSRLARERSDLRTASAEATTAVKLGPNNGAALRELATTLYATQNFSGARAFYARAIKADPSDRISQGYLGCSLIQLGRADEGMRWIRRAGSGTWSACVPAAAP